MAGPIGQHADDGPRDLEPMMDAQLMTWMGDDQRSVHRASSTWAGANPAWIARYVAPFVIMNTDAHFT